MLDRKGRPSGARPRGRESAQGKPDESARGRRDVADTRPRDLHVGLRPLVRKRPLTAPGTRLPQDRARARALRHLASSSPPLPPLQRRAPAGTPRARSPAPLRRHRRAHFPAAGEGTSLTRAGRRRMGSRSRAWAGPGQALPGPPTSPREAARWSAVPQLLPGLRSQSLLLGGPEGPGAVRLF